LGPKFRKCISINSFDLTPLKLLIENCVRVTLALTWIIVQLRGCESTMTWTMV